MAVTAPADKRFRRARVSPAKRRRFFDLSGRRFTYVALVFAVIVYGGYRGVQSVLGSSALIVRGFKITGNSALSREDVDTRLQGLIGMHIMAVDLEEWRQKVLESPWIEAANVRRVFPDSIAVQVVERRPMAVGRIGNVLYLIDESGGVIDEYGGSHGGFDLPLIDGLAAAGSTSDGEPVIDEARAQLAGRLMASLQGHPDLEGRVSQIDVTNPRDAVVILEGDTALIRVGTEQFAERLQSYVDVAPTLRGQVPDIDYVDVRFGERVYVKGQSSRGASRKGGG
jgi:cell division protein FtsQ